MGCGASAKKYEGDTKPDDGAEAKSADGTPAPKAIEPKAEAATPSARAEPNSVAVAVGRAGGAVIFDCDGTLLDTEKLRSEVTFLLLAPYMPGIEKWEGTFQDWKETYIMKAAGRSFKQKGEDVDAERVIVGLQTIAESWAAGLKNAPEKVAKSVLESRRALGLPETASGANLQEAKWAEDDIVLKTCSKPCANMPQVIAGLQAGSIPFNIASTSSQDSLQASLVVAGMADAFKPFAECVHSGESDFVPSAHKPKPDVFLKAAAALGKDPKDCVAAEDSDSGVGAAAHAGMGLIVGYVGGGQIPSRMREEAAGVLMAGGRSENNRGADIVISDAIGLVPLVDAWRSGTLKLPLTEAPNLGEGVQVWLPTMLTEEDEDVSDLPTRACSAPVLRKISSVAEMA